MEPPGSVDEPPPRRAWVGPWPAALPKPVRREPLRGGWVASTWLVVLADGSTVVAKAGEAPAALEAEGLAALSAAGVPVPAVLGVADRTLVLEAVGRGDPPPRPSTWATLGCAIGVMHRRPVGQRYGWHRDNRAGRFLQPNGWWDHWPSFYVEQRLRTHLTDPAIPLELRRRVERVGDGPALARLPDRPPAVLTHGDLWLGNTIAGRWVVDPEVCIADRELDLSYMQMSAGAPFPDAFWAGYHEVLPIPEDVRERRPILELHHRLLQVRHFGAGQLDALVATLEAIGV